MRNAGLDILRFIAVALVIWNHAEKVRGELTNPIARAFNVGGWTGVDIFFVLSGFLVSGLLFNEYSREGQINAARFLIRRGFKIYPGFWVLIGFTAAALAIRGLRVEPSSFAHELLFIQNYRFGYWAHHWSLAVEEHFYLLLVGLCVLLVWWHIGLKAIPAIFGLLAITCLLLRLLSEYQYPLPPLPHYAWTHTRIDSLMFGVLLSYLWHLKGVRFERISAWLLVALGCALLLPCFIFDLEDVWWIPVYGLTLNYLGGGCLLLAAVRMERTNSFILRLLAFLGSYSYSIYLWHYPIRHWGMHILGKLFPFLTEHFYKPTFILGALILGVTMGWLVEMPMLRLRDRLFPTRSRARVTAQSEVAVASQ